MRVCSPVVRKFPGDKRELQIQVLALSDLKLISIKYSLEESKMTSIAWPPGNHSKSESKDSNLGMYFPGKPPNRWQIDQLLHVKQEWEEG